MAKTLKTMALLEQPFIKDTDKDVASIVKEAVSALGENIQIRRFEKWVFCVTYIHYTIQATITSVLLLVSKKCSYASQCL